MKKYDPLVSSLFPWETKGGTGLVPRCGNRYRVIDIVLSKQRLGSDPCGVRFGVLRLVVVENHGVTVYMSYSFFYSLSKN